MIKTAYDMLNDAYMEKEAGLIGTATKAIGSFAKSNAGKMIGSFAKSNAGKMIGAGIKNGAAQGALYGFMSGGGTDANGNKQGRLGSTIKGALTGGMLGGAASGVGAAMKSPAFQNMMTNVGNKINEWGKINMFSPEKTASEALNKAYLEKLAGTGLTIGAMSGAIGGAMRGISKGYAKNGIQGALKSGIRRGTMGMMAGAAAGALLDRISAPKQEQQQNPNTTQNFNG